MDTRIAITPDVTTLVNILTVEPERQKELLALLRDNTDFRLGFSDRATCSLRPPHEGASALCNNRSVEVSSLRLL